MEWFTSVIVFCFDNNNNNNNGETTCHLFVCVRAELSELCVFKYSTRCSSHWLCAVPDFMLRKANRTKRFFLLPSISVCSRDTTETSCLTQLTHCESPKKDAILKDSQFSFTVLMSYRFPSLCVLVSIVIVIRFHHFPFTFVNFNTRILCASFIFSRHTAISRELFGVIFVVAALVRRRFDVKTMPFYLSVVDDLPECLEIDALQKMRVWPRNWMILSLSQSLNR